MTALVTQEVFRDREKPYPLINRAQVYFQTAQPEDWKRNPVDRETYAAIYGDEALAYLDAHGLVCENVNRQWVGGTNVRQTWSSGTPVELPTEPGPGQMWVNTPFGRMIVDKPESPAPVATVDLGPVMEALKRIEGKVQLLLIGG